MDYAPFIRICLRYLAGGMIVGSPLLGEQLAGDPDVVESISVGLAMFGAGLSAVTEWWYKRSKETGGAT